MKYKVGQILFLIGEKSIKIMPIQVIEEVIRTNIDGRHKTYIIQLPDKNKTSVDINDIKGNIFKSVKELREFMISNAVKSIDTMIDKSSILSKKVFGDHKQNNENREQKEVNKKQDEEINNNLFLSEEAEYSNFNENVQPLFNNDIIKVDLGDGQFASLKSKELNKTGEK